MKKVLLVASLTGAMILGNAQFNAADARLFDTHMYWSDNGSGTCTVSVQATFLGIGVGPSTVIDTFSC